MAPVCKEDENYKDGICSVLVSSCDAYEDLWFPFFTILKKQWLELKDYNIVLNTESKIYQHEGLNIKCFSLYDKGKRIPWGKRLIETLQRIDSKYIIFLLDDFFVTDIVDQTIIDKCVDYLEQKDKIATFGFVPSSNISRKKSNEFTGFELRNRTEKWRINTQAAIWRRDKLISYIRPHETAWEWELYGSERSQRYEDDIYVLGDGTKRVFYYENAWGGAIHRGKWTPYAIELCRKYGIDIDFEIRGIETQAPPYDNKDANSEISGLKRYFRPPFFKRMYNYFRMWMIDIPKAKITRCRSLR